MELKPHQQKVVNYMKTSDVRGILLYHKVGTGKTITSIAIAELYNKKKIVIVPASMRTQWVTELKKMKVNLKNYKIISYQRFLNDAKNGNLKSFDDLVAIVDEAHRIRSADGIISTLAVKLLQSAYKVILLTGTPMINSPTDISSLINSIKGKNVLPTTIEDFKKVIYHQKIKSAPPEEKRCIDYSNVICSDNGVKYKLGMCKYHYYITLKYASKQIRDQVKFKENVEYEISQSNRIEKEKQMAKEGYLIPNFDLFSEYIKDIVSSYNPLQSIEYYPTVEYQKIKLFMSEEQDLAYKNFSRIIKKEDLEMIQMGYPIKKRSGKLNSYLNKTRQISNTWNGKINTPKFNSILKMIRTGPFPIIVYSNWIENGIEPLSKMLELRFIKYGVFTGTMNDNQKQKIVERYNEREIDVLLLSTAGGEGLDLKNTRQIHIMEPHWNISKIKQVIGRGVRYKSHSSLPKEERNVKVYYWISVPLNYGEKLGADEYLYKISDKKDREINLFLETIKENSI